MTILGFYKLASGLACLQSNGSVRTYLGPSGINQLL